MEMDFKEPNLYLYRLINDENAKEELRNYLVEKLNINIYKKCVDENMISNNETDLEKMNNEINHRLTTLQAQKEQDPENQCFILDVDKQICELYAQIFDLDNFEKLSEELLKNDPSTSLRMDIILCKIRISIINKDKKMLITNIEEAQSVFETSCDWDRKNKFKVYLGLFYIMKAEFYLAANIFSECLTSFEASELLSFDNLILYLVFSSVLSFSRSDLKDKIINNSEVRKCPNFLVLPEALYECHYNKLFMNLLNFIDMISQDIFLSPFKDHLCKIVKVRAYEQLLSSYQSLHLERMANVFEISVESLEEDLRNFINEGKLSCVIDRIDGVVQMNHSDNNDDTLDCAIIGEKTLRNIKKCVN